MHVRSTLCLNPFTVVPGGGKESIRLFFTNAKWILNGSLCLSLSLSRFPSLPPLLSSLSSHSDSSDIRNIAGWLSFCGPRELPPRLKCSRAWFGSIRWGRNKQKTTANTSLLLQLSIREGHCLQWLGAWLLKPSSTDSNPDHALFTWPLLPNMLIFERGEVTRTFSTSLVYEKDHVRSYIEGI